MRLSIHAIGLVVAISCLPVRTLCAQDKDKNADDDPQLRLLRAQIRLRAAVMNRVSALIEAEMKGEDRRTALEKARERLVIAQYKLGDLKLEVSERTARITRLAEALEARKQKGDAATEIEKARDVKLAASKEVAAYRAASERLLGLVKQREKSIREAADSGNDIRSDFEKAAEKLNAALAESLKYQAAAKRLRAARRQPVVTDLELLESISPSLRAALLRIEVAEKK